jgi:hypothetical protein
MARKKRLTPEEIGKVLIDKMFEIAGHNVTFEDIKGRTDQWYWEWTMTKEQEAEWIKFGEDFIKKESPLGKWNYKKEMGFFNMNYGLKIKE